MFIISIHYRSTKYVLLLMFFEKGSVELQIQA